MVVNILLSHCYTVAHVLWLVVSMLLWLFLMDIILVRSKSDASYVANLFFFAFHPCFLVSFLSSLSHRLPPASPSTHSISGAGASGSTSSERSRLTRGSTIRSTFHGGQLRDHRPPTHAPPTSPTLSHEASPLPHSRSRATTNLFSKLTSKLTRR